MNMLTTSTIALVLSGLLFSTAAAAQNQTVQAEGVKFTPMIVHVSSGDTVNWTNMAIHNVHMMFQPEGVKPFQSEIGQNVSDTFVKQGIYLYQCDPHIGLGMGGAVIVGKTVNLSALQSAHMKGGIGMIASRVIHQLEKG